MPTIPSEDEVLAYFERCSNWGRWGPDDQLGTMNFLTPDSRRAAAGLVRDGISVSCSRRIPKGYEEDFTMPPLHYMVNSGECFAGEETPPDSLQISTDFIGLEFHGFAVTHLDALAHLFRDGKMYNGLSADRVTTSAGATVHAIDNLRDGVVGRGVLLDIPAQRGVPWLDPSAGVYPEDLEAAEEHAGVRVRTGDILLCRFGTMARRNAEGPSKAVFSARPGLHASCLPWLHQREIAVLGSDSAQDLYPSGYLRLRAPMHQVGIVAMGLWLLDNCDLEPLAEACRRAGRWEFLLAIGPLRITNGTGSPVNPIAVF
jgi:kynurenine formamidase